jgi:DNA-binding CsgD family transcriptional regulator/PAS domain-containing protein
MNQEALLNQIYGAIVNPARWPDVLISVSDHIDGIGGMLVYNAPPGGKNLIVLGRLDPEYNAVFHKYHVWNPWTLAVKQQPFDRPIISGSLVDRRIIQGTAFYTDVLAPQKIQDMAVISHRALAHLGGVGGFGFALSAHGADRADQARQKLGRLTVHLCRALDATLRLGPMVDGSRQLERVLQLMPNAALLLDAKGRIIHANGAAERLLRDDDGLTCGTDGAFQLSAVLRNENAALTHVLARALSVADGSSNELAEPLRLTRPLSSTPLLVVPVPLPPPAFQLWELSQSARVLVLIIDPTTRNLAAASALQATFGLTSAEARVATLVGSGLNGPQAAQVLHISPATVKTHLARCFAKMGIRSQVELARTLSGFPACSILSGMNEQ